MRTLVTFTLRIRSKHLSSNWARGTNLLFIAKGRAVIRDGQGTSWSVNTKYTIITLFYNSTEM